MSTPGERFAEAGNELIKGIQEIQRLAHRPTTAAELVVEIRKIAEVCERLIGPYKLIVADLSQEDWQPSNVPSRKP